MKKWLIILAVGFTAVSCQWWHETFDDVKECEEWYLEELAKAKDLDKFEEIYNDYTAWRNELGSVDVLKADEAFRDWVEDNEDEWADIEERTTKVYDKYKYTPKDEDEDEDEVCCEAEKEECYACVVEECCVAEDEECCACVVEECCVAEDEECYACADEWYLSLEEYESYYDYEDEYDSYYDYEDEYDSYYDYEDEYEDYYDYEDEYFYY